MHLMCGPILHHGPWPNETSLKKFLASKVHLSHTHRLITYQICNPTDGHQALKVKYHLNVTSNALEALNMSSLCDPMNVMKSHVNTTLRNSSLVDEHDETTSSLQLNIIEKFLVHVLFFHFGH